MTSDIISKEYFLSPDGANNPESELKATIEILKTPSEASCRFLSRKLWLEKMGMIFPDQKCPEFEAWTRGNAIKSVSLIFASGFLGNPASYFGHPLLKFNFKDERSPLDLLDTAINYGAFTPSDIGAIPYAFYGIFGGFDAGFSSADFFFHKNNYSELELRDLWEYELLLTQDQVQMLVAHIWDMQKAKIRYFFFQDNCAYRMADLLELVTEKEFVSKKLPFAIPSSLFHKLYEYSLVKNLKLLKSRQTRLREKVLTLNRNEFEILKNVTEKESFLKSEEFKALSEMEKSKVLEAALDYYSFLNIGDKNEENQNKKKLILQERIALPPRKIEWSNLKQRPPHEAQRPILTQAGFFYSDEYKNVGSFRFRPVFYDLISPDTARPPLSSLTIFDLELNVTDEKIWLKSIQLIGIESLNLSHTNLAGDGGIAWRINAGADQLNLACNTCTVAFLQAGAGKAWKFSESFVFSMMIDPRLQTQSQESGYFNIQPNLSALLTLTNNFRVNVVVGRRFYFNDAHMAEDLYRVEGRIGSHRTWDLRVKFEEHVDRRYGAAFGYYW